jgi:HEAT repeat protein
VVPWEDKFGWILRLEDARILRDPNPPPPVVLVPATRTSPAIVAPPPPSDLVRLLADPEPRVRQRVALAVGRVGLAEALEPLTGLLADPDFEVRRMAAFALGLVGDARARPALIASLKDADPGVQGRAAEALGAIGDRADAAVVGEMVQGHVKAGALAQLQPDELGYPLAPSVEAARLGLYALARLGSYEALASAVLDANGAPVASWWPVAYALQRVRDPRGIPALQSLLAVPGRYTASFAARGLGDLKAAAAAGSLMQVIETRQANAAVMFQAVRALAAIGGAPASPVLRKLVADVKADTVLRVEALVGLGSLPGAHLDLLLDLTSDSAPPIRAAAMEALARADAGTFLTVLSGLDPDPEWTVRAAQASALGALTGDDAAGS